MERVVDDDDIWESGGEFCFLRWCSIVGGGGGERSWDFDGDVDSIPGDVGGVKTDAPAFFDSILALYACCG